VEAWHPDPDFFYQRGGGPLFDMGPYHLTALAMLLGPIRRVSSFSRVTFAERTITSAPRRGARISVTTPTHVAGIMDFASGAVGTLIASFDVWSHGLPDIEIYGSEGSLQVPDPNFFRGPVKLRREGWRQWVDVTSDSQYRTDRRGLGLADMATALRSGGSYRATGRLAYHVLDTMHAFYDSSESGRHIELESTVERPESLPLNLSLAGAMSGDPWLQRFWRRSPPA
jgi:predicted dehydrogenase